MEQRQLCVGGDRLFKEWFWENWITTRKCRKLDNHQPHAENEKRISELQDNFRWPNVYVIGVLKGEKRQEEHLRI